jgi:putative phosphoribosyl transferase
MASEVFRDRREAGQELGRRLLPAYRERDVLVLALPRGGVPVAYEVALALHAPLDVIVVRKLGVPGHEEYAMGAIASGGIRLLNDAVVRELGISPAAIEDVVRAEHIELERRERLYRDGRPPPDGRGRTVLLVDDGLATGSTMLVAIRALRAQQPARVAVAVPIAAADTCESLRSEADDVLCARTPWPFRAVGLWYRDFSQTSDDEVGALLRLARQTEPAT